MIDKNKLEGFIIFKDLSDSQLGEVCDKFVERSYNQDEIIFSEGDV